MEQEKGAVYCRLSQDDGSAGESGSIQTQRTLLTQYCKEHSIQIVDYYCDDGWSGTNFERPEFKRMIDDIENGKINTVIVKDLSRFGREYAQMGLYIEHYFEEKGIRFIAVAEGIDSKKGLDNLMLPMTNVINSLYARQASTKTKAAHRARAGSGMFIGSRAPFGYQKDPDDRHHLIVDPEAAEVVKSIFQMFADGIGYVRMTKILRGKQNLTIDAAPAFQLRRYGWSGNLKVSVLTNFTDLYIYDCSVRPREGDDIGIAMIAHYHFDEYVEHFEEIYNMLSKEAVLTGQFERHFGNIQGALRREPFDQYFLDQIRTWRMMLGEDILCNNPNVDAETLNIFVQRVLNRTIFLRICEDRCFENYESLKAITTYQDLRTMFAAADQKYDSGLFELLEEDRLTVSDSVIIEIFQSLYYPS